MGLAHGLFIITQFGDLEMSTNLIFEMTAGYDAKLRAVISDAANVVSSASEARSFLSRSPSRTPELRLVSWLWILDLLPNGPMSVPDDILDLINSYSTLRSGDRAAPSKESADQIRCDVPRGINWFVQLADSVGIEALWCEHAEHACMRILETMEADPAFLYHQGFDRYVFIPYLLCLGFVSKFELPLNVAESLAFSISRAILRIANPPQYLTPKAFADFADFDSRFRDSVEIYSLLAAPHNSSAVFALHWKLLWFADEHSGPGSLTIWDHILANLDHLDSFISALCLAHARQINIRDETHALVQVQTFREWDVPKIIESATLMLTTGNRPRFTWFKHLGTLIVFIIVLYFLIHSR
jgi:hypothetical protein